MGRFSKLETGTGLEPVREPAVEEALPRVRRRAEEVPPPHDYDQGHYLAEADKLYYAGEYQKALRQYSRAMQVDQSAVDPWLGQVMCLVELKQYREASMWALRSLELFPEEPRLVSVQGLTYALGGTIKRALACSDYAISRPVPGSAFVWALRGHILSIADNSNASFCFDKAMEVREKDDWRTPMRIGLLLLQEKKWSRAAEFLQLAVQSNPRNGFLWKKLGLSNEKMGLSQPALEAYQAAMHLNVDDREASACIDRLTSTGLPARVWRRLFSG
ncbi:MAG: tetratricopeptide repeat protein [Candidatus Sumerlaeaceae bacterium]